MTEQITLITALSNARSESGGTSLITLYIPGGSALWLASEKMTSELSTASNIKSKTVRKDVEQALRSALYQIKNYVSQKAPENGLVLCSGSVIPAKDCL